METRPGDEREREKGRKVADEDHQNIIIVGGRVLVFSPHFFSPAHIVSQRNKYTVAEQCRRRGKERFS